MLPVTLLMPDWLNDVCQSYLPVTSPVDWMKFVIELSRLNVVNDTGGPFGAAVINVDTGELIAAGVNRVVPLNGSIWHGEMTAIAIAQAKLETFDLSSRGNFAMVTSCSPCAMCFGAIPWSGVKVLVYGATKEDAERIGFNEGDKPRYWKKSLERRGVSVQGPLMQSEARDVLDDYHLQQKVIYNSCQ
jgi:tRNA(Arg) A34 adenosine deaminase TadA